MTQPQNKAGDLDSPFGTDGVVTLPFGLPVSVLPQPEDKLLVAVGATQNAPAMILRLEESGKFDPLFGTGGIVKIPFGEGSNFSPRNLHPLPNGWLITGTVWYDTKPRVDLAIVRHFDDGSLDPDFGNGGRVLLNISELVGGDLLAHRHDHDKKCGDTLAQSEGDIGATSFAQQDGKIVLVSTVVFDFNNLQGIVISLNADGSPNLDFNHKGFVLVELPDIKRVWNEASGVVVQPDGEVLVCGRFTRTDDDLSPDAYVIRYHANGDIDSAYGDQKNGVVIIADPQQKLELVSMTIKPDGGIIASGSASRGLEHIGLTVSLNPGGSYNRVFNKGKPLLSDFLANGVSWRRSILQKDGKIIVMGRGGRSLIDENSSMVTARMLPDGSLDPFFNRGWVKFKDKNGFVNFRGGTLMSGNRVVVCGYISDPSNSAGGRLVRYLG